MVSALRQFFADENFINLLRAEGRFIGRNLSDRQLAVRDELVKAVEALALLP